MVFLSVEKLVEMPYYLVVQNQPSFVRKSNPNATMRRRGERREKLFNNKDSFSKMVTKDKKVGAGGRRCGKNVGVASSSPR